MSIWYGTNINNKNFVEKNKQVKKGKCLFPFTYKKKSYDKCLETAKGPICATSLSEKNTKRRTLKTYGYCYKINKTLKNAKLRKNKLIKKIEIKQLKTRRNTKPLKMSSKILNTSLIDLLEKLTKIMKNRGEFFRAKAYSDAADAVRLYDGEIVDIKQLNSIPGIGKTVMTKFKEFIDTGTLKILEKEKNNPIHIFTEVYGIGPKKAVQLVEKQGITTISQLRKNADELLTSAQKAGLKYYEDILKRIPRKEIDTYKAQLEVIFRKVANPKSTLEIVGSYRRGAETSGDIDIIISDPDDDSKIFSKFLDELIKNKILVEVLSRGKTKSLGISQLPGKPARRIDFMYTSPKEFPFAILYFTGSKTFNTIMRARALELGYSMNEHGLTHMKNKKKTTKLETVFPNEQAIFEFLGMKYVEPPKRIGHGAYVLVDKKELSKKNMATTNHTSVDSKTTTNHTKSKRKTLKTAKKNSSIELIKLYKKKGDIALKSFTELELSGIIRYANEKYYCNNKSVMTDGQYDLLKEYIEEKFPDNKIIHEGHTKCSVAVEKKKVALPYPMMSMDKIKPDTKALDRYKKTYNQPKKYVRSAKLDGISALYTTEGKQRKLYTRGNGTVGQDISHAIKHLNLPEVENITIRGELLMNKNKFKKWGSKFSNGRNMVAGTANAKEAFPDRWKDIDFVAYEVIKPELKPSDQFKWLETNNVITAINNTVNDINNESLSKQLIEWRETYPYDIDGVIVEHDKLYPRTATNPKHAFAFKMVISDQIVESPVLDVIWSVSKHGYLKPKVRIKPIKIGGAVIEYATAHNAAFVRDNNIGVGALVQMIRSGDVIPKIHKVIQPSDKPNMPENMAELKWNDTNVDLILKNIQDNSDVQEKKILAFFESLGVEGLGKGNVRKIIKTGFDTLEKILSMSVDDFLLVDGFKDKMANKIFNSIHNKVDKANLIKIMTASNIFGRGMGGKRLTAILQTYPNILTKKRSRQDILDLISKIDGFGSKTATTFVNNIPAFKNFLRETKLEKKLLEKTVAKKFDKSHKLYGKKIVLSGFRDKDLINKITSVGGELSSSISSNISALIVKDPDDSTNKIETAKEKGVAIMTPETFIQKYF